MCKLVPKIPILSIFRTKTDIARAVLQIGQQSYTFLKSFHRDGLSGTIYNLIRVVEAGAIAEFIKNKSKRFVMHLTPRLLRTIQIWSVNGRFSLERTTNLPKFKKIIKKWLYRQIVHTSNISTVGTKRSPRTHICILAK